MQYSRSETIVRGDPDVQQWSLISKYKGIQEERMRELQRQRKRQKMMMFKNGLDSQIHHKVDVNKVQKERDQSYHDYVMARQRQIAQREETDVKNRRQKRKQVQLQNQHKNHLLAHSRTRSNDTGYHLDIGQQSQRFIKQRQQKGKKQMLSGLELQLKAKNQQNKIKKIQQYYLDRAHKQNQPQQFDRHTIVKTKQYGQNQHIYNYYQQLLQKNMKKRQDLQKKYIDQAANQQINKEKLRQQNYEKKKHQLSQQMKDSLAVQVKIHNHKKYQERMTNPEDSSFQFIKQVYKNKYPGYNKQKYFHDLREQAQEQKVQKKKQSLMSEEEYKFNKNQLNKIANGQYSQKNYLDRSLGAIGENHEATNTLSSINDRNSGVIRDRLSGIRTKNEDYLSRLENSYH